MVHLRAPPQLWVLIDCPARILKVLAALLGKRNCKKTNLGTRECWIDKLNLKRGLKSDFAAAVSADLNWFHTACMRDWPKAPGQGVCMMDEFSLTVVAGRRPAAAGGESPAVWMCC